MNKTKLSYTSRRLQTLNIYNLTRKRERVSGHFQGIEIIYYRTNVRTCLETFSYV